MCEAVHTWLQSEALWSNGPGAPGALDYLGAHSWQGCGVRRIKLTAGGDRTIALVRIRRLWGQIHSGTPASDECASLPRAGAAEDRRLTGDQGTNQSSLALSNAVRS